MALTNAQKQKIREEEEFRLQVAATVMPPAKQTHGMPALLSFFIPGLGQIIKGEVLKGILVFIGFVIGVFFLVIPGVIIWIWQIADAYTNQTK